MAVMRADLMVASKAENSAISKVDSMVAWLVVSLAVR
jgi:hypothetical protein